MSGQTNDYKNTFLSGNLDEDIALFKEIFKKDCVLRIKRIKARKCEVMNCALVYMDGMVDSEQLNDAVIEPILSTDIKNSSSDIVDFIENQVLYARDVKELQNVADIISGILYGEALLLIDGSKTGLNIDVKGWKTRGISEPQDERVLKGPREGFEEAALLNIAMLRRKLQTPDFCTEPLRVGRRTGTMVFICYLDSLTDSAMLEELKKRIKKIDIDGILDSNYIAELIRDHKYSFFKTNGSTERPDVIAAKLLEGRIAVVVDGTPVVITFPYLFSENFQSDEDYYQNFLVSSIGRMLRYFCFFLAVSIPAVFIAVTTFHRELLPTSLAIAVAQLRGGVPFSPFTECLLMIIVFEILKETGARMPQSLGHALGIVGGLVVGQAAVDARIISTPMLIVIALSGISGLMIPKLNGAVFYYRFIFLFLGVFLGLFGYIIGISGMVIHILSLNSLGVDYTSALRRGDYQSLKDTFWRTCWKGMLKRPSFNRNIIRKSDNK